MRRVINVVPGRAGTVYLAALPFVLVLVAYGVASAQRLAENPNDKLLPAAGTLLATVIRLATEPDKRSGDILLWADTGASLLRLGLGVGLASLAGLAFGILNGLVPLARAALAPFVAALSMIPPLAVLPILFIVLGLGELSKVVLIVIGIAPFLMRDLAITVSGLPREQIVKAQTLGASSWQVMTRVVLPQVLPRLIEGVRLALGPAWLFLISAEAIAATEGLGYRIFLVRRYLAMDVILPYVAWITLIAFALDFALQVASRRLFPWHATAEKR